MKSLFHQMLRNNGEIPIVTESVEMPVMTEAVFSDSMDYMKLFRRVFTLEKGETPSHGVACFLLNNRIEDSIQYLSGSKNALRGNWYHFYYLPLRYSGKIVNKQYREKIDDKRTEVYGKVDDIDGIFPYTKMKVAPSETRNIFYDLSHFIEIFNKLAAKLTPIKRAENYWIFLKSILANASESLTKYPSKFVLVDITKLKFDKAILSNLDNPMALMYYTLYKYPSFLDGLDIDFIFFNNQQAFKVNPAKNFGEPKKAARVFKTAMVKMANLSDDASETIMSIEDEVLDKADVTANVPREVPQGIAVDDEVEAKLKEKADSVVAQISNEIDVSAADPDELGEVVKARTEQEVNADQELLGEIYKKMTAKKAPSTPMMSARDAELKKKQEELVINGMTVAQIQKINPANVQIPVNDVSSVVRTTNKNMHQIRFNNFERAYNEQVMTRDLTNAIMALNGKSIPMYVRDIKVEDTSNELNYKETWTIYLEDANRQRHTVKVDIPKFYEDKFLYLGGNRKLIKKQNFLFPVVKTGADTVQIVTNYNKMFIRRVDTKSVSSVERIKRMMKNMDLMTQFFTYGMAIGNNSGVVTTIEYDELSKIFVRFKSKSATIFFNQNEAAEYRDSHNIIVPAKTLFIGHKDGKPIFVNTDTQLTVDGQQTIIDLILDNSSEEFKKVFEKTKSPKRLMYTKVKVMNQDVALVMLLCFWEGFSTVLQKMGVKYELTEKAPSTLATNQNYIQFADCYCVFEETMAQALILNGLRIIDTTLFSITDMDSSEPYMKYFIKMYGKASIANALNNFYEFMIDPITEEVCRDINIPTQLVDLIIYAVNLLADSQFIPEIDQRLSRIRSNEIVAAILYEALAKNYVMYRNSNGKKKYSIPQDIVIKELVGLKTVEDYSTLNPALEMGMTHSISSKGFRGANLDESYTIEKRAYHDTMSGIISPGAAPDGSVGVNKTLSCEPTVTSVRGYVDIRETKDHLKDVNLFSPVELTMPLASTRDDPTRLGHAVKQSSHVIPVKESAPVLMSSGMEEACRFKLSSDFVVNADEDGEVVEYDEETKIMVVRYKSGKHRAVSLAEFIVKNGGGGFYLSNQLVSDLKVGDKFKKNEVLAYHKNFFTNNSVNSCRMNMGTMAKVAIMSTYNTVEDATIISQRFADAAATELCFQKQAVIGMNANVTYMVQKGKTIKVGDPLIQFDTSYDDSELNQLLAAIGDEDMKSQITEEAKNVIKSKYSGVIEEIEVYSTVPLEALSPSLRKLVSANYRRVEKKKRLLEKYDPESKNSIVKCGLMVKEPTHEIEPNKYGVVRGQKVENSVLINFYIKHTEPLEIGSKIANFTALKNVVSEIFPEGYEPYSSYRPEEIVDEFIASNSILKRMVPSILLTALGNKVIIELKRHLQEIYES